MQLLDRVHFKRNKPLLPVDFMNFTDKPESLKPVDEFERIDREVFGL